MFEFVKIPNLFPILLIFVNYSYLCYIFQSLFNSSSVLWSVCAGPCVLVICILPTRLP